MTSYFVAEDGESTGPFTGEQVAARISEGKIDATTLMWKEGMAEWLVAAHVLAGTGLLPLTAGAMPPSPPRAGFSSSDEIIAETPVIAAFGRRIAASLIDGFVLMIPLIVLLMLPHALLSDFPAFVAGELLVIGASLAYYGLLQSRAEGATVGKRAVGIRVVRDNGEALSLGVAVGRYVLLALFGMLLLPYLVPLFNRQRKGLHDMICGTVVVEGKSTEHPALDLEGAAIGGWGRLTWVMVCLLLLVPFAVGILAAISIPAYQDYVIRAKVAAAIEQARDVSAKVVEFHTARGQWPASARDLGLSPNAEIAGVATMNLGEHGTVSLTFTPKTIEGIGLEIRIDDGGHRQCITTLPRKYVDRSCSPASIEAQQKSNL